MSDQLENFIRNNQERFDQESPSDNLWNRIESGMDNPGSSGQGPQSPDSSPAQGWMGKLAQISSGWKAAAGLSLVALTSAILYFALPSNQQPTENSGQETAVLATGTDSEESTETELPLLISPPMSEVDVSYVSFTINAKKGGSWTGENGTIISVPKGIFVDAEGNAVKGDVEIQYREFHDAADIILSGITMKYDENGQKGDFQTAGMMEIKGSQGGAPVYIADGKSIQVSMASFTEEDDHNLYFLDPEKGWTDIGRAEFVVNKNKQVEYDSDGMSDTPLTTAAPVKPRKPAKATEEGGIAIEVDYEDFPEIKPYKDIRWKPLNEAYFLENQWAMTVAWNDISLKEISAERLEYRLKFTKGNRKFQLDVTPMLQGDDYDKAVQKFGKKMKRYENKLAKRRQKETRNRLQADVLRSFNINGFGVFNCDRLLVLPNRISLNADIDLGDPNLENASTRIFHITADNRSVIPYTYGQTNNFIFSPNLENYLVALKNDGQVAVFSDDDFNKLDQVKLRNTKAHTFNLKAQAQRVESAADLRMALGI